MRKLSVLLEFPALGCARVRTAASAGHPYCSKRKQPLKSSRDSFIVTSNYDCRFYPYMVKPTAQWTTAMIMTTHSKWVLMGTSGYREAHGQMPGWSGGRERELKVFSLGKNRWGMEEAWDWLVSGLQQVMWYSCGVYSVHGGETFQAVGSWRKEAAGISRGIIWSQSWQQRSIYL